MDDITIRPLLEEEIELLEQMNEHWPYGRPLDLHRQRFAMQQAGEGVYLFAWHEHSEHGRTAIPVGHVFVRWQTASHHQVASQLQPTAYVSDLFVIPAYWSRGIGTRLMETLEVLAERHGCLRVGLSVDVDNTRARSLYANRGYLDAGFEARPARWTYIDPNGQEQVREETFIYLVKRLAPY